MAGELVPIGLRPKLVAAFDPPAAEARFREWRSQNEEALAAVPESAWRVEYGRTGVGPYVRVRIDEDHLPESLRNA
ncbi:MAG TPA: hypothetical protein VFW80_09965 [Gaiellaceae bacterium]|nr:hypothetical protein [Gaiellaceae bacterium]